MWDGIVKNQNGTYTVYIKYQDGTETVADIPTKQQALEEWKDGHKCWNGVERKKKDCPIFEWIIATEAQLVRIK